VKDDRLYIHHILDCIGRIQEYCAEGVWRIVAVHLPVLLPQIEALRNEVDPLE
jgi:uncharacterized protein with HEPN domain